MKTNCEECKSDANPTICVASVWSQSAGLGQCKRCPAGSSWNYHQNGMQQMRCDAALPQLYMAGPQQNQASAFEAISDTNPSRFRVNTHVPANPEKLKQGSIKLTMANPMTTLSRKATAMTELWLADAASSSLRQRTSAVLQSSGLTIQPYCEPGFKACGQIAGLPYAGLAGDGCARSCDNTLSNPGAALPLHASGFSKYC